MKKTVYLLCLLLITASTFMVSSARAQSLPCNGGDPVTGACPVAPSGGTGLPINGGVVYLLIAGFAIGLAAVKKQKIAVLKA